jgi:cation:H+ antiporter
VQIIEFSGLPLVWVIVLFVIAAAVIAAGGTKIVGIADRLADETGWGEAILGGIFLGATTSIPDTITSMVAAYEGYAGMAVSNAVGGVIAQMSFLAIADLVYRKANLEHAAASVGNLVQAALLGALLGVPIIAMASPEVTFLGIHPATPIMIGAYILGLYVVRQVQEDPLWRPRTTPETRRDDPKQSGLGRGAMRNLWGRFLILAVTVAAAGLLLAESGIAIAERTGLTESFVGAFMTAVATSLGELVTSIAAVRQGALTLAVAAVIGGNTFDLMLVPVSDLAYRGGSVYHAIGGQDLLVLGFAVVMSGVLLVGMVRREKIGVARMGLESFLVLALYLSAFGLLVFQGG